MFMVVLVICYHGDLPGVHSLATARTQHIRGYLRYAAEVYCNCLIKNVIPTRELYLSFYLSGKRVDLFSKRQYMCLIRFYMQQFWVVSYCCLIFCVVYSLWIL